MTFTDDDLKQLKRELETQGSDIFLLPEQWKALLARLAAAELVCLYATPPIQVKRLIYALEAWLKASGRRV